MSWLNLVRSVRCLRRSDQLRLSLKGNFKLIDSIRITMKQRANMVNNLHQECLLLAVIYAFMLRGSVAQFPDPCPNNFENTVKYLGDPFSFPSADSSQQPNWQVAPADQGSDSLKDITNFYDSTVVSPFETTYTVDATQLTIFTSTVEQQGTMPYATAGLYLANYLDSFCTAAASLTVIESGPMCTCDATTSPGPTLSCEVTFSNYDQQRIIPIMTWIDNTGTTARTDEPQPTSIDFTNQGLQHSVSQYQINANDDKLYQCQLTFSAPDESQQPMIATNAPNFIATCNISNCARRAMNLTNTVVYQGSSTAFARMANDQTVQWQVAPASSTFDLLKNITNYDDKVTPEFIDAYTVNQSQLTITNSTVTPQRNLIYSTAGLYILNYQENQDLKTAASLTVIESGPVCTCDASDLNSVMLSCRVKFANFRDQQILPIITWKDNNGNIIQKNTLQSVAHDFNNPGLQSSSSQLSVADKVPKRYECQLTFSSPTPTQPNFIAANAPNFTASCFISSCGITPVAE